MIDFYANKQIQNTIELNNIYKYPTPEKITHLALGGHIPIFGRFHLDVTDTGGLET